MVSAKPPVWCPIGSEPNFCAYIWLSPHGSKRDGISVKSLPAKIRRACPSLKPMTTPIASGLEDLVGSRQHEIDALLMNQPRHEAEDRAARQRQAELLADVIGVRLLALPVAGGKRLRQLRTDPRIPAFVDAVQYSRQLLGIGAAAQQAL